MKHAIRTRLRSCILAWAATALAAPTLATADPYADLTATYSLTRLSGMASPRSPTILAPTVSATLGYAFFNNVVILGGTSSYTWVNQTSSTAPPVGNWTGRRWSYFAPTLGFAYGRFALRGSYEFLGSYDLKAVAQDGSRVAYRSPSGFQVATSVNLNPYLALGLFYRQVSFALQDSTSGGEATLATPLRSTDYGLSLTITPFAPKSGGGR